MALKIIHVMEFQILFAQILFHLYSASAWRTQNPTSGLKSCVHDFLLHCLVFKEHCLLTFNFLSCLHESAFI